MLAVPWGSSSHLHFWLTGYKSGSSHDPLRFSNPLEWLTGKRAYDWSLVQRIQINIRQLKRYTGKRFRRVSTELWCCLWNQELSPAWHMKYSPAGEVQCFIGFHCEDMVGWISDVTELSLQHSLFPLQVGLTESPQPSNFTWLIFLGDQLLSEPFHLGINAEVIQGPPM